MMGQMDKTKRSEQEEIDHINAFFAQFTLAEQDQLMAWVDELTTAGHVDVPESHPLHQACDLLMRFIGHQTDDLMVGTVHKG